jgi:hypothetical protein
VGTLVNVPALVASARRARRDEHGVPLPIIRRPDGHFTVEARVLRDNGMKPCLEAFTLEKPHGERVTSSRTSMAARARPCCSS